jgi:hypothetical protein
VPGEHFASGLAERGSVVNYRLVRGRTPHGAVAQLGERVLCKHEVVGSIPIGSTNFRFAKVALRSLGEAGLVKTAN